MKLLLLRNVKKWWKLHRNKENKWKMYRIALEICSDTGAQLLVWWKLPTNLRKSWKYAKLLSNSSLDTGRTFQYIQKCTSKVVYIQKFFVINIWEFEREVITIRKAENDENSIETRRRDGKFIELHLEYVLILAQLLVWWTLAKSSRKSWKYAELVSDSSLFTGKTFGLEYNRRFFTINIWELECEIITIRNVKKWRELHRNKKKRWKMYRIWTEIMFWCWCNFWSDKNHQKTEGKVENMQNCFHINLLILEERLVWNTSKDSLRTHLEDWVWHYE